MEKSTFEQTVYEELARKNPYKLCQRMAAYMGELTYLAIAHNLKWTDEELMAKLKEAFVWAKIAMAAYETTLGDLSVIKKKLLEITADNIGILPEKTEQ